MFERLDTWTNKIPLNVRLGVVALVGVTTLSLALQSFIWPLMATPLTLAPINDAANVYDAEWHDLLANAVFDIALDGDSEQHTAMLWDNEGHLLVPAHAIADCRMLNMTLPNGNRVRGRVVGYDLISNIGVITIEESQQLGQAVPKRTRPLARGEQVYMLNRLNGQTQMVAGEVERVSTVARVETHNGYSVPFPDAMVIAVQQPLAHISNVGVFDGEYRLVGVSLRSMPLATATITRTYALPITVVAKIVDDILTTGEHAYPWLGFAGETVDPEMSAILGLPETGVYVIQVLTGSPAEQAGLRGANTLLEINNRQFRAGGDVIVAFNGQPVHSMEEFITRLMHESQPGETITLTVMRGQTQKTLTVVVGKRPDEMFLH